MFWVHGFEAIKNDVSDTPADANEGIKTGYRSADIGGILSQEKSTVKRDNDLDADIEQHQSRGHLKNSDATRGVYINDRTQAFTEQILNGEKTIVLNNNRAQNIAAHII